MRCYCSGMAGQGACVMLPPWKLHCFVLSPATMLTSSPKQPPCSRASRSIIPSSTATSALLSQWSTSFCVSRLALAQAAFANSCGNHRHAGSGDLQPCPYRPMVTRVCATGHIVGPLTPPPCASTPDRYRSPSDHSPALPPGLPSRCRRSPAHTHDRPPAAPRAHSVPPAGCPRRWPSGRR